jgi:hypothetical protein
MVAALAAILVACDRQAVDTGSPSAGRVVFEGAGVSLVPGDEWQRIGRGSFSGPAPLGVCLPTLAGRHGLIQVLLLPADQSDPRTAAADLRARFDVNFKAVRDSFRQEAITVPSGARVIYVTYRQQPVKEGGDESASHNYIVQNREGLGVAINYITMTRADSDAVHQMIRQTLRVQ